MAHDSASLVLVRAASLRWCFAALALGALLGLAGAADVAPSPTVDTGLSDVFGGSVPSALEAMGGDATTLK